MKLHYSCFFSIFLLVSAVPAQEPVKPPLTPRIITATRQVTLFTGIEKQMLQAVESKNRAQLESMLAEDCSIALPRADSLDCSDWLDSVMSKEFSLQTFAIRGMSVTDMGDASLVNYERVQKASHEGKDVSGEFFVLDLWKKSGGSWKLVNRYVFTNSARVLACPHSRPEAIKPRGRLSGLASELAPNAGGSVVVQGTLKSLLIK
jgi:hypothetical protein